MPPKKMNRYLKLAPKAVTLSGAFLASLEAVAVFGQGQLTFALLISTAETGLSLIGLYQFLRHRNII